jgi:hypothetical protein
MCGACSTHGSYKNAHSNLVGKPEGKRPLGRSRRRGKIILEWIIGKYGEKV